MTRSLLLILLLLLPLVQTMSVPSVKPPIVYTIAGSDSGGGAGIQADLHAIHSLGGHGCSAITCLTAQNSCGVTEVHAPPPDFLRKQLDTLTDDLPPRAIKIGMLGTKELAECVGDYLSGLKSSGNAPLVVLDPVMISTSGHKLINDEAKAAMIEKVFPHCDILTPNKYEAEALLEQKLNTPVDVEQGARKLLSMGVKSVLIKGGHSLMENSNDSVGSDVNATLGFAQDYFLSSAPPRAEPRLCDGDHGVWIRTDRFDSQNTHGTGCTLSSSIATALALGHLRREISETHPEGATAAIELVDACCLGKAYVAAGIGQGVQLGSGPGPVVHTEFPSSHRHFPSIATDPTKDSAPAFRPMKAHGPSYSDGDGSDVPCLGRILPIVDTVEWVEKLTKTPGVEDIQLRIKDESDPEKILERIKTCQAMCAEANVRLWINDHWEAAVEAGCFGVHVGQEDLVKCMEKGGLDIMREKNTALGISTHSYGELAAALGVRPTYISMGPVFGTVSKNVNFDAQGLYIVKKWRQLIPPEMPFVVIGGIGDAAIAKTIKECGGDCAAVIGAVTKAEDVSKAVADLNNAMSG